MKSTEIATNAMTFGFQKAVSERTLSPFVGRG